MSLSLGMALTLSTCCCTSGFLWAFMIILSVGTTAMVTVRVEGHWGDGMGPNNVRLSHIGVVVLGIGPSILMVRAGAFGTTSRMRLEGISDLVHETASAWGRVVQLLFGHAVVRHEDWVGLIACM